MRNVNRTVGTMLGSLVTPPLRRRRAARRARSTSRSAARPASRSARSCRGGITLRLFGDANDYVGKGLSGGVIAVRPDEQAPFAAEQNVIAGNVIALRRDVPARSTCAASSASGSACATRAPTVVAEGVGDHALEYMTGGIAVILGPTGRNLGAGMSGGLAFVLDLDPRLVNSELVDVESVSDEPAAVLRAIVQRHAELTDSAVAAGSARRLAGLAAAVRGDRAARLPARRRGHQTGRGARRGRRRRGHGRRRAELGPPRPVRRIGASDADGGNPTLGA